MKTMLITFFDIEGIVHIIAKQAYYVKILKELHEAVHRKMPELWPNNWILHHDNNAPAHKTLSSSFWPKN
jgi:hypothetical protein